MEKATEGNRSRHRTMAYISANRTWTRSGDDTGDSPNRLYRPLDDARGISRAFLKVADIDSALAFANQFGLLGLHGVPRYAREVDEPHAERAAYWVQEATELRQVYEVWDLLRKPNDLHRMIFEGPEGGKIVIPDAGRPDEILLKNSPRMRSDQALKIAKYFIAESYNWKMNQMASPALLLDAKDEFRAHNRPSSLLAAIWLEFGAVASGASRQTICETCGEWMDVTENREDKRKHTECAQREASANWKRRRRAEKRVQTLSSGMGRGKARKSK